MKFQTWTTRRISTQVRQRKLNFMSLRISISISSTFILYCTVTPEEWMCLKLVLQYYTALHCTAIDIDVNASYRYDTVTKKIKLCIMNANQTGKWNVLNIHIHFHFHINIMQSLLKNCGLNNDLTWNELSWAESSNALSTMELSFMFPLTQRQRHRQSTITSHEQLQFTRRLSNR